MQWHLTGGEGKRNRVLSSESFGDILISIEDKNTAPVG